MTALPRNFISDTAVATPSSGPSGSLKSFPAGTGLWERRVSTRRTAAPAAALWNFALSLIGIFLGFGIFPLGICAASAAPTPPPPRILYNNDTYNILSSSTCAPGATVPDRLRASIDEALPFGRAVSPKPPPSTGTGTGAPLAHVLSPGNAWVPWWKSTHYPADKHYRWFTETTGLAPDPIGQYLLDGGDLVAEFVSHCRRRGIPPLVSIRLNDYHGAESMDWLRSAMRGRRPAGNLPFALVETASQSLPRLLRAGWQLHPEPAWHRAASPAERLRLSAQREKRSSLRHARIWNWAIPEVPAYKLGFIREICAGYDIDGLELDFMRWPDFFPKNTAGADREAVMLDFIRQTRAALDATTPPDRHRRWLVVRIPARASGFAPLGINLRAWLRAGVDLVNLSCHYTTDQQAADIKKICRAHPGVPVYLELTQTTSSSLPGAPHGQRLATPGELLTTAHLAYSRGARGVSLFNFAYYRLFGKTAADAAGPPFDILETLADPARLARCPQEWFLSHATNPPSEPSEFTRHRKHASGKPLTHALDLAPPAVGWRADATLRVQFTRPLAGAAVTATFNGRAVSPSRARSATVSQPPLPAAAADNNNATLACTIPASTLKPGPNKLTLTLAPGAAPAELHYISLTAQ
ncbi:MAG: hypothetical protein LBC18_16270 [Opitutaceae bacterium]|jgi:hypothetical protein|nr:hypothetical protein [Opitutaceae bacterium]